MGERDKSRKGKKRAPAKLVLDDDLIELAVAIAQYEIDEGCGGWLKMPWRSGWNAAQFALDVVQASHRDEARGVTVEPAQRRREECLQEIVDGRDVVPPHPTYWEIQEILENATHDWPLLRAAFRCVQVMLTASGSGDGTIFNAILAKPLDGHDARCNGRQPNEEWIAAMESARCRDSIGVPGPALQNDGNDWLRSAFRIAWRRRLYAAAYSLPPARKL